MNKKIKLKKNKKFNFGLHAIHTVRQIQMFTNAPSVK